MVVLGGVAGDAEVARALLGRKLRNGEALAKLRAMVTAQGGDARVIDDPDRLPRAPVQAPAPAPRTGVVAAIDATAVGVAAMRLGAGRAQKGDVIDPAVGVVVERTVGTAVRAGEALATVHAQTADAARRACADVAAAFLVADAAPPAAPLVLDVMTAL
jgi:thymidine phosphorylase